MRLRVSWVSRAGVRPENQDCVLVAGMLSVADVQGTVWLWVVPGGPVLLAVFDGLGGHAGGGVASRVAAGVLGSPPVPHTEGDLVARVGQAHRTVASLGGALAGMGGMATTLSGFLIDDSSYRVVHVGDSAAYRLVDGSLGRLTEPHRVPDPRRPGATVLTRCLGAGTEEPADTDLYPALRPVRLLACSDGVSEVLTPEQIRRRLGEGDEAEAAAGLVSMAAEAGSRDNMTALVIDVLPDL